MNAEQLLHSLPDLPFECLTQEPLSRHTSFHIGGPADVFLIPEDAATVSAVLRTARAAGVPTFLLGRGTNVLFDDKGFRGVIISTGAIRGLSLEGNILTAGAGDSLTACSLAARDAGLSGLVFACGIPGSVGGAVYMNAGAYGSSCSDVLTESEYLDPQTGKTGILSGAEHRFAYRHSVYQENGLVLVRARFRLQPGDREELRRQMEEIMECRAAKQPLEYPSAGSTFRRPEGHFAGQLIEAAGLKGYAIGGAQVSVKHAGFVINRGGASAEDVRRLVAFVQETVLRDSGVLLEPEMIVVPER